MSDTNDFKPGDRVVHPEKGPGNLHLTWVHLAAVEFDRVSSLNDEVVLAVVRWSDLTREPDPLDTALTERDAMESERDNWKRRAEELRQKVDAISGDRDDVMRRYAAVEYDREEWRSTAANGALARDEANRRAEQAELARDRAIEEAAELHEVVAATVQRAKEAEASLRAWSSFARMQRSLRSIAHTESARWAERALAAEERASSHWESAKILQRTVYGLEFEVETADYAIEALRIALADASRERDALKEREI